MHRRNILIQGIILISVTIVVNVILSNMIFSERFEQLKVGQSSLVRSVDHVFTALIYMEKSKVIKFDKKVKHELDEARKSLRAPELLMIRRNGQK